MFLENKTHLKLLFDCLLDFLDRFADVKAKIASKFVQKKDIMHCYLYWHKSDTNDDSYCLSIQVSIMTWRGS